jgi:hypothetical protein
MVPADRLGLLFAAGSMGLLETGSDWAMDGRLMLPLVLPWRFWLSSDNS